MIIAFFAAIIGGTGFYGLWDAGHRYASIFVVICTLLLAIVAILRGFIFVRDAIGHESAHELEGCLHTLHAILVQDPQKKFPGAKFRLTIHVPTGKGHYAQLRQITHYVGDGRANPTAGREFAIHSGVIGEAYRTRQMSFGERKNDDYEAYIKELVDDWAYTEEDARKLNRDTNSWLAIPLSQADIRTGNAVVAGVVYFDSTARGFFDDDRKAIAAAACEGIALFIQRRYS